MVGLAKEYQRLDAVFRSLEGKVKKREREIDFINDKVKRSGRPITAALQARKDELANEIAVLEPLVNQTADIMGQIE